MQCSIRIIYASHESGTREMHGGIFHYTLKELRTVIGIGTCWVNLIWIKEKSMDPTLDNQIVRASKIGLCQLNGKLCIHVIVNNDYC